MKVDIVRDERWPDYSIITGDQYDIPDEVIDRIKRIDTEYAEVQDILESYYKRS